MASHLRAHRHGLEWIYYFAPDVRHRWVWITPGSVTAATLGLLLSLGWYASHFGDYQKTYGAIGGVIVVLLWFYGSGLAILIGAELNATIEQPSAQSLNTPAPKPSLS